MHFCDGFLDKAGYDKLEAFVWQARLCRTDLSGGTRQHRKRRAFQRTLTPPDGGS